MLTRLRPVRLAAAAAALFALAAPASAQELVKYGAEFLAGGVGARALGMGGAYVSHANDVTAGYWNPAGLDALAYPEAAYMHAERFGGVVAFDYGAVAMPVTARSTVGVSFFRSGVDDIPNTLNVPLREDGTPAVDPEAYVDRFSAADYALFVSYARKLDRRFRVGATGKLIRRSIGDFASAWGYSFDVGAQASLGRFVFGVQLQDISTMVQSWSVNEDAFLSAADGENVTEDDIRALFDGLGGLPQGQTEIVAPTARLGSGVVLPLSEDIGLTLGADVDVAFDGQRAYVLNAGDVSFRPRLGTELSYRGLVALRAGISDVTTSERYGTQLTPTLGAGVNLNQVSLDYGFGDFGGLQSELGYAHRISLKLRLEQPRFARAAE